MKKTYYLLAIIGAFTLVACSKKIELSTQPRESEKLKVTIHASFGEETKTSYANEISFSWTEGDKIGVWTTDGGGNYEKVIFEAESSGPSVDFTGVLSEGFHLISNGKAFYPDGKTDNENNFESTFDGINYTVTLGETIDIDLNNPMSVIPLIGNNDGSNNYYFTTATGIVKVHYDCLQELTSYVSLDYNGEERQGSTALSGTFTLATDEVQLNNFVTHSDGKYLHFNNIKEGASQIFYFPIPTGTLPVGMYFTLWNSSKNFIDYCYSNITLPVTRNKITNITQTISGGSEWKSLGKGYYMDNYTFGLVADKTGTYVQAEIQQNNQNPNHFRVVEPYQVAWEAFGVTTGGTPSTYVNFDVKRGDDMMLGATNTQIEVQTEGLVYFYGNNSVNNAVVCAESSHPNMRFVHPNWANDTNESHYSKSKVISYQSDGVTPEIVQLAPGFDLTGQSNSRVWLDSCNDVVYIVFPNCDPVKMITGTYYIGADISYSGLSNRNFGLTIEKSNNPSLGNIMITNYTNNNATFKNASGEDINTVSGECYGTYSDGVLTFSRGQKFAVYDDASSKYWTLYVGLKGNHSTTMSFPFAAPGENKYATGKVLTIAGRIGLGYGTESDLASGKDTEIQTFSTPGKMIKDN